MHLREKSGLTSNLEGAAAGSSLVDDVTRVLSIAIATEATHRVLSLIACIEVSCMQQAGAQTPLVPQYT